MKKTKRPNIFEDMFYEVKSFEYNVKVIVDETEFKIAMNIC